MAKILIIDDEATILQVMTALLKTRGHEVVSSTGGDAACDLIAQGGHDLMISDIRMSPIDGMKFLAIAKEKHPAIPVIMMTGYASITTATDALKLGVFDYVLKPFKVNDLLGTVDRALEKVAEANNGGGDEIPIDYFLGNVVALSHGMQQACEMIKRVAPTPTTVLLRGEKGSGLTHVAMAIHSLSRRSQGSFNAVSCDESKQPALEQALFGSAVGNSPGGFDQAGGTLYLEDVDKMNVAVQTKLLRVLKEKKFVRVGGHEDITSDVRALASTSVDLQKLVAAGSFTQELFYRLCVVPVDVPPLRDRREDVVMIAHHLLKAATLEGQQQIRIDSEASTILQSYDWPGNIAELEKVVSLSVTRLSDGVITKESLPSELKNISPKPPPAAEAKADDGRCKSLKAFLDDKRSEIGEHFKAADS